MKNQFCFAIIALAVCLLFLALQSEAVYEGTANANMMIRRYERKEQFGKAALWREAAAKCLDMISIPLAEIVMEYCQRTGNLKVARSMKAEIADTKIRRAEHLRRAKLNWEKAKEGKKELDAERVKIDKFIAEWVPHYPDRFYEFGTYNNVFGKRIDTLKEAGRFDEALLVEADASDMCARQYEDVTIKYFRDRAKAEQAAGLFEAEAYREVRDRHLGRSAMLRLLAGQGPENWPAVADEKDFEVPQSKRKLTVDKAIELVRADRRVQQILEEHRDAREFAWFQGFCWTVSYYSRGWENLGIVFVDDETAEVTDFLASPGDLEDREWDEEKRERDQELRLSPDEVIKIAREHPKVKGYFEEHPDAKTSAAYNWRYNCWMVEVILNDREVGVVTVSDKTEKVLEIALDQDKR